MDALNCDVYEVNGRRYRRNVPLNINLGVSLKGEFDLPDQVEDDEYDSDLEYEGNVDAFSDEIVEKKQENSDECYPITYNSKKRAYIAEITVPEELLGKLIGAKGSNKRLIEDETGAKIEIPKRGEIGPVVIMSSLREAVERCYDRIEIIIFDNRKKLNFTHFVLVPIDDSVIMEKHEKLIENIRSSRDVSDSCKDPSLFVNSNRLHLTIAPMWLISPTDFKKAEKAVKKAIHEFKNMQSSDDPINVSINGLSHFGDEDIDHIRVVYGKVHSPKLQQLADIISKSLMNAGLSESPRGGNVKLHMTILNTRYLATEDNPQKQYIDATGLLNEFNNFNFGNTIVDKIQVSTMSAVDVNTGGYPVLFMEKL